jgi:hypothetical protein
MIRFLLLMAGVMAASASIAGGASRCPADTVPIQIVGEDEIWTSPVTVLSSVRLSENDQDLHGFVTAVTEHIAARLAKEKLCINNAESRKRSLLQFVDWSITYFETEPVAPVLSLDTTLSGGCRISSPWIDLAFGRKPVPWIRGVVRWNEHQALVDQAMLAGERNMPTGLVMPLKQSEFFHFAQDYSSSVLLQQPKAKSIGERIPPEILWLFRRSRQEERVPFEMGAANAMHKAMGTIGERHAKLVTALIDRCLASDGVDINYKSILDVADLISLEQYKIVTPIK